MTNKHLGEIESAEPSGAICPICESSILKLVQNGPKWLACECAAMEDYTEEPYRVSGEVWAKEIQDLMQTHPDRFPLGSVPGPIDEIS